MVQLNATNHFLEFNIVHIDLHSSLDLILKVIKWILLVMVLAKNRKIAVLQLNDLKSW